MAKKKAKKSKKKVVRKAVSRSPSRSVSSRSVPASFGVPTGVKVIAILKYLFAALLLILSLALFLGSSGAVAVVQSLIPISGSAVLFGAIVLILAVINYLVAKGLWSAQNWARIFVIVVSVLLVVSAIMALIKGQPAAIIDLAVFGLIGGYLWFNSGVKAAFT